MYIEAFLHDGYCLVLKYLKNIPFHFTWNGLFLHCGIYIFSGLLRSSTITELTNLYSSQTTCISNCSWCWCIWWMFITKQWHLHDVLKFYGATTREAYSLLVVVDVLFASFSNQVQCGKDTGLSPQMTVSVGILHFDTLTPCGKMLHSFAICPVGHIVPQFCFISLWSFWTPHISQTQITSVLFPSIYESLLSLHVSLYGVEHIWLHYT